MDTINNKHMDSNSSNSIVLTVADSIAKPFRSISRYLAEYNENIVKSTEKALGSETK